MLRLALQAIYLQYINQFLTIGGFADYHHITDEEAETLIRLGKRFHEEIVANPSIT